MSKKKEETSLFEVENQQLPSFMKGEEVTGTEDLGQYIIPPRLKVVQKQADDRFLELFDPGDVVLVPQMLRVSSVKKNSSGKPERKGEPFRFVPLFFFPEWVQWNPLEMKGSLPAIRQRTTDPNDELVAKCRNQKLWLEECPENPELNVRNVEHLNFIIMLLEGEVAGTPIVMSFSRAEHKAGSSFAALIKLRRAPIFGCIFEGAVGPRDNAKGSWVGIDVANPSDGHGWVEDQKLYERFKELHMEFKEAHSKGIITPDYGDDLQEDEPSDSKAEF